MPQAQSSIEMKIAIDPNVKKTLDQVSANFKTMNVLLKDNIKLLSKTVQTAFKIVETPLDVKQRIARKNKIRAAKA